MAENKLADMSTEFSVKILNLTDSIKGHYSLANQLERSGMSIGANIREAKYAHSKAEIRRRFHPNKVRISSWQRHDFIDYFLIIKKSFYIASFASME